MERIFFSSLDLALAHAFAQGGWIAKCCDGSVQWFNAQKFTMTPVLELVALQHGGGEVGTWAHFMVA